MYLSRWKVGGGVAVVYVYVLEPRVSLNYSWTPPPSPLHICIDFWTKCAKGQIQGRAIIGQWGPFSTGLYSNKLNIWQWSKSIWEEVLIFLAFSFDTFWCRVCDLVIIPLTSFQIYLWGKVFSLHSFTYFSCKGKQCKIAMILLCLVQGTWTSSSFLASRDECPGS